MNYSSIVALLSLVFIYHNVIADDNNFWQTPAIEGFGKMHPLPQSSYQPSKNETHKAIFWLTKAKELKQVNLALESVARAVNLYASAGVPLGQLKFVAIISGPATATVLDNVHYKKQYGIDNPNLPMIKKLTEAGVEILVCGQAVAGNHYQYDWIDPQVKIALSGITTIIDLQQQGYALVPL
ncbi:hypothetical conserved protein [Candidatus Nitrosoglobus terrae]|uniref:Hypothetical conserved protein n=1 Tax=Candidatus Nitrosoglobus terrae TaxID=1630141 RepID=A0A1Q2SMZ0_9GAMM|nr:DsrE family protein [Candidatus Nitrosoglobus terrae]BAW80481.1 hypothetical conserved protein [Candidatus Nitrosoglobus terrae]